MSNQLTTKERVAVLEQKVDDGFSNVNQRLDAVLTRLDKADGLYAAKWVQTVVGGLVGLILVGVASALLALVVRATK